jgi:hypothetical protein
MWGASPSGCRATRMALSGGSSSSGAICAVMSSMPALASTMFQWRSTAAAGYGSWPVSTWRTAARTSLSSGASSGACE